MNSHDQPDEQELRESRWTAYALGQLEGAEQEAVERELQVDADARRFVEEIRELGEHVKAAQTAEPLSDASPGLREWLVNKVLGISKETVMVEKPIVAFRSAKVASDRETRDNRVSDMDSVAPSSKETAMIEKNDSSVIQRVERRRRRWSLVATAACSFLAGSIFVALALPALNRQFALRGHAEPMRTGQANDISPTNEPEPSPGEAKGTKTSETVATEKAASMPSTPAPTDAYNSHQVYPRMVPPLTGDAAGMGPYEADTTTYPGATTGRLPLSIGVESDAGLMGSITVDENNIDWSRTAGADPAAVTDGRASRGDGQRFRIEEGLTAGRRKLPSTIEFPKEGNTENPDTVESAGRGSHAPGTEQYAPIVENLFLTPFDSPLSTFSIDLDTASYANVRRFLDGGRLPPADAVRIEEMVNYFDYDYPTPEGDEPFSVHFELADCPWRQGHRLLRVGLKGREIPRGEQGPSNLVFLLDVSGSMADENKLPLVQKAMRLLVERLTEDDRVAIVTYADGTEVRLESTNGQNKEAILAAIDSLQSGGSTNGSGGIQLAYQQAAKHFLAEGNNRVILATDGDLNVGITDDDELARLIAEKAKSGVFLSVLGFGTGNLQDAKLETLADRGNGHYAYIDNLREARKVLIEEMTGSQFTIAKDVKIQIEFNPARVAAYRLIGYENRLLAARDFDDDKKDAGEIGAGHTVTALYEIVPVRDAKTEGKADESAGDSSHASPLKYQKAVRPATALSEAADSNELATVRLRYKRPDGEKSQLLEEIVPAESKSFSAASPDFQFASAVASFAMVLRGSRFAGDATLAAIEEYASPGLANDAAGHRAGFVDLVRKARKLMPVDKSGRGRS